MLSDIVSVICRVTLLALGWKTYPPGHLDYYFPDRRVVVLFSHSSYWDFVIFLLYRLAHPELSDVYAVMKPQPFRYFGRILRWIGFVPASPLEKRGGGFVHSTIETFATVPRFSLLISPKGTIASAPWRTGYYYLAKGLDAQIQVAGLDYHRRGIAILPPRDPGRLPEIEPLLKKDMEVIHPLYPSQELHPEKVEETSLVSPYTLLAGIYIMSYAGATLLSQIL